MEAKELNRIIDRIVGFMRKGYSRGKILSEMIDDTDIFSKEKLFEIAKCRIKSRAKFGDLSNKLFFDEEGLRYSTPPEVAKYRAERLRCKEIADVSCGVGIQALFFAMNSDKVIAVERDSVRLKLAKLNAENLGIFNIHFIHGDALSKKISRMINSDIVFSDPSRKAEEKVRTFDTLEPSPVKIYEIYRKKTDKLAFEIPPQISKRNILIDGEKEYTSLEFRLNRLALYTNSLKDCEVSAISLPDRERITDRTVRKKICYCEKPMRYIYEIDPTVIKSGLFNNLLGYLDFEGFLLYKDKRRTILTSTEIYESSFLRCYKLLDFCRFELKEIKSSLRKIDARKVTLRMEIEPRRYWFFRKNIEKGLSGIKKVNLFKIGRFAVIAEKDSPK